MKAEGFQVETGLGHIATAFSGRFGSGRPVIGILGEFDALRNLSQKAGVTHQESAGGLCCLWLYRKVLIFVLKVEVFVSFLLFFPLIAANFLF